MASSGTETITKLNQRSSTFPRARAPSSPKAPLPNQKRAVMVEEVFNEQLDEDEDLFRRTTIGSSPEYILRQDKPRISRPVELIRPSYDVVVIGSGYGGGVAASRMARSRRADGTRVSVAVLEIGKERWPGEYPESTKDALSQLHLSGDFSSKNIGPTPLAKGKRTGLYHLILGEGQNAFVANGLGGTSLLNANVFLEPDKRTMQLDSWPEEIRNDPDCLQPYFARARHMLQPQIYPDNEPELTKLNVLREQAELMGLQDKFRKVEQTTWFKEDGLNNTGVHMKKSKLTGMDSTGVNDGSKSTTLVTYLADAWNWGAEIFCECEVRHVKKHEDGGYMVYFACHRSGRDLFSDHFYQDLMWVHAKEMVFLGAGSLGSTEILLRSRSRGLSVSNNIGQNMSGNGDLLSFGYNLDRTVNGISRPESDRREHQPVGPTIAGIIDCRDTENPLDGFVLEEGAIPSALAPFMQFMLEITPGRQKPHGLPLSTKISRNIANLTGHWDRYNPHGSLEKTQTYLIMSHDSNQATLTLEKDNPRLSFRAIGRQDHVARLNALLEDVTKKCKGTYVDNPFFAWGDQNEITVHPVGGASMSKDNTGSNGVTNHLGQVFAGEGSDVHPGLVVLDGAIVPTALGANPFATITALAERSVHLLAQQNGFTIDYDEPNGELDLHGKPKFPITRPQQSTRVDSVKEEFVNMAIRTRKEGFEFTEIMEGFIHEGDEIADFETAKRVAEGDCQTARFFLSAHAYDRKSFLSSNDHEAMMTGTFSSGALKHGPYMVHGAFKLFTKDVSAPGARDMVYQLDLRGTDGKIINFEGRKVVDKSSAFSIWRLWKATTTLKVVLTDPEIPKGTEGHVIGKGILYIKIHDLWTQLWTIYANMETKWAFFKYFTKNLAFAFFAPFDTLSWASSTDRISWSARNSPSHTFIVQAPGIKEGDKTEGQVESKLHMWQPTSTTTQHMELLFIAGAAVDEQVFNLPTIQTNAIRYFRDLGYRCWCIVHRVGKTRNAKLGYTTYDARLDIAAAIDKIDQLRNTEDHGRFASKTYIVAHCAGSIALASGLLTGDIKTETIAGITASQVFMHPILARINSMKASIPYATQAYTKLISGSEWFDCTAKPSDGLMLHTMDQLLRFYPVWRPDLCNSRTCHRSSFIFGLLFSHDNLNKATHDNLSQYLGGTSMACQRHLISMGTARSVLDSSNQNTILNPTNLERLRNIPILFLSSDQNFVYDPESTSKSYELLQHTFGPADYEREVFEGYGHLDLWMGEGGDAEGGVPRRSQGGDSMEGRSSRGELGGGPYARVRDHLKTVEKKMRAEGINGFAVKPAPQTKATAKHDLSPMTTEIGEISGSTGVDVDGLLEAGINRSPLRVRTGWDGVDVRGAGEEVSALS